MLGSRADVLRRRPAARRRRISHSAQALPFRHLHSSSCAQCMHTGSPCTWVARQCPLPPARRSLVPSSLSTTSRAPRGQLLLLAVPSSCSSLPSAVPRAATDRADHAASVPPAALRTQSTRRADEPPGLSHVQTARRRGPPADHASSSQSEGSGAPHFAHDALGTAPPGGEAIDGAGAGEGPQGEAAARPYDSAPSPSLARPPQAPCPSHPPQPPHRSPPSDCCCVSRTGLAVAPSLGRSVQLIGGGGAGAPRGEPGGRHGEGNICTPPLPLCRVDERQSAVIRGHHM